MKRNLLLPIICGCIYINISGQQAIDTTVNLDLLKAPTSVAFNLMGIAPSDIERPTDLTSFAMSLRNATSNFSKLPTSYSIEFAPAWLFRANNLTLDKYSSTNFRDVFNQSFNVSIAYTKQNADEKEDDSSAYSKLGFGVKFSIIRPRWTKNTQQLFDTILYYQKVALSEYKNYSDSMKAANPRLVQLKKELVAVAASTELDPNIKRALIETLRDSINLIQQEINNFYNEESYKSIKEGHNSLLKAASNFKTERAGPSLDFSSGFVTDFPDNRFNYSLISKAGAWITGGYEGGNNKPSFLGILRYLYQPDKIFADEAGILKTDNISTFDAGGRVLIKGAGGKFIASAEGIYRSVLKKNTIDPNWRFILNVEYDVGFNQKLTFAFGKNFDGTISKDGNLIAALNFIKAFGAQKKLPRESFNE